jgi:hypothetical protein
MNEDTTQTLIVTIALTVIITSLFFFYWDYNKTELINFDETDFGYKKCISECRFVSGNNGKTNLDEVECIKGCNTFYYGNGCSINEVKE